jgi:hypothetical protein
MSTVKVDGWIDLWMGRRSLNALINSVFGMLLQNPLYEPAFHAKRQAVTLPIVDSSKPAQCRLCGMRGHCEQARL